MQITKEDRSETARRTELLDGAAIADEIKQEVAREVTQLWLQHEVKPCLAAVRVGDDPASAVYVRNKIRACEEVGIRSEHQALPAKTTLIELLELITSLNLRDDVDGILVQLPLPAEMEEARIILITSLNLRDDVDGILVQLPLPAEMEEARIIEAIAPEKDVDAFHPVNVGRLAMGRPTFVPCTQLLLQRDATVTICHSRTRDLAAVTREADVLVVAIGRPGFIGREHIKPGATVIDVGMNKVTDEATARKLFGADIEKRLEIISKRGYTLVGDVNPAEADEVARKRTPVPGGVGLLTVAMLMRNTVKAARMRRGGGANSRQQTADSR